MSQLKSVGAYVPESWHSDADEMGISTSEYVRRMARSGRRQWGYDHTEEADEPHVRFHERANTTPERVRDGIEATVLRNLSTSDGVDEDTLLEFVIADLEEQIEEHLQNLKDDDKADYEPSKGGWVKKQ